MGPAENWFGIGREIMERFVADEGDEEGVFVDDDGATTGEAADKGNGGRKCIEVDEVMGNPGDAEDNGGGGAGVDEDVVVGVVAQKLFFEEELVVDGGVLELDKLIHEDDSGARP